MHSSFAQIVFFVVFVCFVILSVSTHFGRYMFYSSPPLHFLNPSCRYLFDSSIFLVGNCSICQYLFDFK